MAERKPPLKFLKAKTGKMLRDKGYRPPGWNARDGAVAFKQLEAEIAGIAKGLARIEPPPGIIAETDNNPPTEFKNIKWDDADGDD